MCQRCRRAHSSKDCPLGRAKCYSCGKKGHIARVCKSRKKIGLVESMENNGSENENVDILTVGNADSRCDEPYWISVKINSRLITLQIDTGSSVTILSKESWLKPGKPVLQATGKSFLSYSGHYISIRGMTKVEVEYKETSLQLDVYIAEKGGQNLLGRSWIRGLELEDLSLRKLKANGILAEISCVESTFIENNSVNKLLSNYSTIFEPFNEPCSKLSAHLYLKPNAVPVFKKARPVPFALKDKVNKELDRLIKAGVIEPVECSKWAAPCVIVRKPSGDVRICADFSTGLNQSLEIQTFPLPTSEEIFAKLNGGKKFSVLDISDAYLSIPVDKESQELLVINTIRGLFRYKRLCFGVAPAPAIFQRAMHSMIGGLDGVATFLDDIIVTGENDVAHLNNLGNVLAKIKEFGFCLNKNKCNFLKEQVNYLGFSISEKGVQTRDDKIKAIIEISRPTNLKQLEAFLGMVTYYSKFISKFSEISNPLNQLRKKNVKWDWTNECENAFNSLKLALRSAPVLTHYDAKLPLVLAADASSVGIGCSLMHRYSDGTEKPIAYASKTLNQSETAYSQIEREALAIIYAIKKFRMYLLGRRFILQTDHRPLLTIFGSKKGVPIITSARLQRWALLLTSYSFEIEYVPTAKFGKVDGLSRLPASNDEKFDINEKKYQNLIVAAIQERVFSQVPISAADISTATAEDQNYKKIYQFIQEGWPGKCNDEQLRPFFRVKNELSVDRGCILYGIRVVIPPVHQEFVLKTLHSTHMGVARMKAQAREKVWWPGLDSKLEDVVHSCPACNIFARNESQNVDLSPWPEENQPWSRVHIDFAGPFYGKMYLLVVDAYSRWLEVVTMSNITTVNTIKALKQLWNRYGPPKVIVSDNGTTFTSREFQEFCKQWGSQHITTPAYHPQSNGQVEKYVDTFKRTLKKLKHSNTGESFEELIQKFLYNYRSSPHSTTRSSPAELFLGRKLRTMLDMLRPGDQEKREGNRDIGRNGKSKKRFRPDQEVYVRNYRPGEERWTRGRVMKRLGTNTWLVEAGGTSRKCHNHQIRWTLPGHVLREEMI